MKNTVAALLLIVLLSFAVMGCQSDSADNAVSEDRIVKASIVRSGGFGAEREPFAAVFDDEETIERFNRLLTDAVKGDGIVNMANPEWELELEYGDGRKSDYYLWVGEPGQRSVWMDLSDTHTIYTVSPQMTEELITLAQAWLGTDE